MSDEDKSSSLSALAIARLMSDEDKSSSLSALAIARLMSEEWRRNFMFLLKFLRPLHKLSWEHRPGYQRGPK